jgi:hypothetical protein
MIAGREEGCFPGALRGGFLIRLSLGNVMVYNKAFPKLFPL